MTEFDAFAGDYDAVLQQGIAVSGESKEFFAEQRIAWLKRCLQRLAVTPARVLDFGCGTGTATPYLLNELGAQHLTGVDVSQQSIEVARQTYVAAEVDFVTVDALQPAAQFDLAFCNGVFHHIPAEQRAAAFGLVADCLRPGGVFALWENSPWSPAARYVMSRIPFDRDAVMVWPRQADRLTSSAGLHRIRIDYRFIFPHSLRWLRFIEPWVGRVPLGAQYQMLFRKPQTPIELSGTHAQS